MSNRRSRYTITFAADGRKIVILAYSAQQVKDHYARQGHAVGVRKGDYRIDAQRNAQRAAAPAARTILQGAIMAAAADLGIKCPVKIVPTSRQGATRGNHSARYENGQWYHRIMVKSYLDPDQMSRTLWHELAHAMQFERDALPAGPDVRSIRTRWRSAYFDGTSYGRKPYEVEARTYEGRATTRPLAR